MVAYSEKAQPFLNAIADGMFGDRGVRDWVLQGTAHEEAYRGADVLIDEQRAVPWHSGSTKQPFWANYSNYRCGKDSRCTCRIEGSKGLESDAIFFHRNPAGRVLAIHVEFKHPGESFGFGQAEAYPLHVACFAQTHPTRKTFNAHDDWTTVLFCGEEAVPDPRLTHFKRIVTHSEARQRISGYPA